MLRGRAGDAKAHAELLHALAGYLRGYFGRWLGADAPDLEDLVQETLLAVHLKGHTYDAAYPFTAWAYGVARYKLIDHFRRRGARRETPLEDADVLIAAEDPAERAASGDVARLLSQLPERQRALLRDVKLTGLSIEEASQRSGMSVSAVKVSIHRGMKAMAKKVRDEDR
jgi:RNA polymerase sigma-70 factor (ECF subfamily)